MFALSRHRLGSLLVGYVIVTLAASAIADDILVTTDADSGPGSLREAFGAAVSGDRIVFDIPGTPTITLLSDLPTVAADISFANNNPVPVTIDRNGTGPINVEASLFDPTNLVINTSGAASPDTDILTAPGTTVFGDGAVIANIELPGTLAPGVSAEAGEIGTLDVTGSLNVAGSQVELDIAAEGGSVANDLINVAGSVDISGATVVPNFVGDQFAAGQTFLVLDSTNAINGSFANQGDLFALPNNPFLQAVQDVSLGADDFGFLIEDNGNPFTSVTSGCTTGRHPGI